jgi:hypothetical protein
MRQCRYPKFARLVVLISMQIEPQPHPSLFGPATGPLVRNVTASRGWRLVWDMLLGLTDRCNAIRNHWVPNSGVVVILMLEEAVRPILLPELVFVELKLVLAIFAIWTK